MNISAFTNYLLQWYSRHRRDLPWRNTNDPYFIWLSEIILQQTRVVQGLPYFEIFSTRFPTVQDLANASEDEILRCWQGLGYYSRARNLHTCAKKIVQHYNGEFPRTYAELLDLPGVGPYTAAAIASFAFQIPVAVVDGNVFRVLSRHFGVYDDISSGSGKKSFEYLANQLIPHDRPDEYNQAIMEFGALQCTPRNPACAICPLRYTCHALATGEVASLPVKLGKTKVKKRFLHYYHIRCGEKIVVNQRSGNDIWKGLVDFPSEEREDNADINPDKSFVMSELRLLKPTIAAQKSPTYTHLLSHQRIIADFVQVEVPEENAEQLQNWAADHSYFLVNDAELEAYGKPKLILRYLNEQK